MLASGQDSAPRLVLLAGGPGNGKTEAVEFAIERLDYSFKLDGALLRHLKALFDGRGDLPPPRVATVDLNEMSNGRINRKLLVVQDASASDAGKPGYSPASLLASELAEVLEGSDDIYLACVNRGVLDDALIGVDNDSGALRNLLESVVRSVGLGPEPIGCWPLSGFPQVGVWPMDVESLVQRPESAQSPMSQLLGVALDGSRWPAERSCPAGGKCPFCTSRHLLATEQVESSLLRIFRWYELASGKRFAFRDLFSLVSYVLSGLPDEGTEARYKPCEWAAKMAEASDRVTNRDARANKAPFVLVGAQFQHALFCAWPKFSSRRFRADLNELQVQDPILVGFGQYLGGPRLASMPATLEAQLLAITELLDPGLADPDDQVAVSGQTAIPYRQLDARFSQSVQEGLRFVQRYHCLSPLEVDLLRRLAASDEHLSEPEVARRRPAVAARIQALLRGFCCRLVRRSLGARAAAVKDAHVLADFEVVVAGDKQLLYEAARQVENLLNAGDKFVISLNTTFGQPLPPGPRKAVLNTPRQKVKPQDAVPLDRPDSAVRFLSVGSAHSRQVIPLTYDLFKSVRELSRGMMPASLPRTVVALLDTTRARLAGAVVRDEELLDGSDIQVGNRPERIVRELNTFLIRHRDDE